MKKISSYNRILKSPKKIMLVLTERETIFGQLDTKDCFVGFACERYPVSVFNRFVNRYRLEHRGGGSFNREKIKLLYEDQEPSYYVAIFDVDDFYKNEEKLKQAQDDAINTYDDHPRRCKSHPDSYDSWLLRNNETMYYMFKEEQLRMRITCAIPKIVYILASL